MAALLIPDKVVLRLVDSDHVPIRVANVQFIVHAFATRKNDFNLGPFATGAEGVVTMLKRDLLAEASAHYDSGLMDYDVIENCQPVVEIAAMEPKAIEQNAKAVVCPVPDCHLVDGLFGAEVEFPPWVWLVFVSESRGAGAVITI
jgi:hypothetical protein